MSRDLERVLTEYAKTYGLKLGFWDKEMGRIRVPKPESRSYSVYDTNVKVITSYLKGGYSTDQLVAIIRQAYDEKKRARLLTDIFPAEKTNGSTNICKGDEYHPQLFTPLEPPVLKEQSNGYYKTVKQAGIPTRKKSYTMDDLLSYYYRKLGERVILRASLRSAQSIQGTSCSH